MGRCLLVTSVVLLLGGCLLAVPSVATPFWALSQNATAGAVYSCLISSSFSLSQCQLYTAPAATDIVLLVTSLAIISALCFVVAAILGLVLLCQPSRCLRIATVVFALVAVGLMVSVLVMFGVRLSRFAADADVSSLHFSYWLATLGAGLELLGTVLLMCVRLPQKVTPGSSTTFTRMSRSEERERAEALFVKIYSDFLKKHPTSLAAVSEGQQEATQEGAKNRPAVLNEDRPPKPQARSPSPPPVHQARSRVVLDNSQAQMVSRARSVVTEPIRQPNKQRLNSHGPVVNPQAMELAARRYSHPQHSHLQMTQQQQPHQQQSAAQQQRQLQEAAEYHSLYQHHQQLREMEYHHHNHYHQHLHQEHPHHNHQHQQQATQVPSQTEERGGGEVMRRGAWETVPRSMPGYPGVAAPGSVLPSTPPTRGRGRGGPVSQSRPFVPRLQLPGSLSDDNEEQSKKGNYGYQRF